MLFPWQRFCEDVCRIVVDVDIVVLHNLPLMQVMAVVIAYVDMFRPGLANVGGDMRERTLGVGVNLCRGELIHGICTVWIVCSGNAVDISLQLL